MTLYTLASHSSVRSRFGGGQYMHTYMHACITYTQVLGPSGCSSSAPKAVILLTFGVQIPVVQHAAPPAASSGIAQSCSVDDLGLFRLCGLSSWFWPWARLCGGPQGNGKIQAFLDAEGFAA